MHSNIFKKSAGKLRTNLFEKITEKNFFQKNKIPICKDVNVK
jgi:hypothetical protein